MFNKLAELKEKSKKAQDAVKEANEEFENIMHELDDDVLDEINGAGNPFASHPRVSSQKISSKVRNDG